jgi:energy-coupling factor transporter transmembrane protein EcfT
MIKKFMRFWSEEHALSVFLLLLAVEMFVMGPVVRTVPLFDLASDLLFSILLVAGVLTVVQHRTLQWTTGVFVLLAIAVRWAGIVFGTPGLFFWNAVFSLLSILAFLLIVLWWVYREGPVTGHRVRGAIAAYLLLALCFSLAYDLIEYVHPGSFTLPLGGAEGIQTRSASFLYFSVVTLTTVGFGDIAAVHPVARSLVMVEALVGTLYPAILLARLVTLQIETRRSQKSRKDGEE